MLRARNLNVSNQKDDQKIRMSSVMKRKNERKNEVMQIQETATYIPKCYGDRFIPRRYSGFPEINANRVRYKTIQQDVLRMKIKSGYWRQYKMDTMLCDIFNVNSSSANSSVLKFSDHFSAVNILKEPSHHYPYRQDWACRPRNRPLAFVEAIHDLPSLKKTVGRQLIDWSAKNEVVAILSNKLVIWQLFSEKTIAYLMSETKAVVYDKTGNYLALATRCQEDAVIHIWDTSVQDKRFRLHTEYLNLVTELKHDEVSCMAWNARFKIFCGTLNGTIFVFDFNDKKIKSIQRHIHDSSLVTIKFSPKYRYLASCDALNTLKIWYCEGIHLEPKYVFEKKSRIFFDFHPWKEHEMAIAVEKPAEIYIFNVATQQTVAKYKQYTSLCQVRIHEISFCKLTAELLVCLWYKDERKNRVLVLSAMDQVVDVLEAHEEPVHNVVWSPDGKVLGTASHDQTFVLWNFFGLPAIEEAASLRRPVPSSKSRLKAWVYEGRSAFEPSIR